MKKSINKLICTLIATAMIIVMLPMTVFAENIATLAVGESNATAGLSGIDGVAIDETNFPDANFRSYVAENYDYDKDGFLSSNECAGPRGIGIPNSNITSLKGIEYFNELTNLNCSDNKLTSLDVSKNLKLEMLACGNNQLTNLDVSQNSKLASLECKYNQLTSLDVTKNAELQDLNCDNNKLTELDVSQNSKLVFLNCEYNQLTSLDVNNNSQLANLYCSWNPLTALDVTKNRNLENLNVSGLEVKTIDLTGNPKLEYFHGGFEGKYESIDISKCPELTTLSIAGPIKNLDVSNNPKLEVLDFGGTQVSSIDISNNPEIIRIFSNGAPISSLDVSHNIKLQHWYASASNLTSIDVTNNPDLELILCANNKLTSLDLSKNPKLIALQCYGNSIAYLDTSKNARIGENPNDDAYYPENNISPNQITAAQVGSYIDLSGYGLIGKAITPSVGTYDIATAKIKVDTPLKVGDTFSYTYNSGYAGEATVNVVIDAVNSGKQYTIEVRTDGMGTASANYEKAAEGTEVTLTATPKAGYEFAYWKYLNKTVTVANHKFTMPASDVVIMAHFTKIGSPSNSGGNSEWTSKDEEPVVEEEPIEQPPKTNNGNNNPAEQPAEPAEEEPTEVVEQEPAEQPDEKKPAIKDENGKEGWDVIADEIEKADSESKNNNNENGNENNKNNKAKIDVNMNGATTVPADVLETIKGKELIVTFNMDNGVSWSIDGESVTSSNLSDIDFSVETDTDVIPKEVIKEVAKDKAVKNISLAHDGEFGFTAVLTINMGEKAETGYFANLYYYNEATGKLEFISSGKIDENGNADLTFTHASDYTIVISETDDAVVNTATENTKTEAENGFNFIILFAVLAAVAVVSAIAVLIVIKKKAN